MYIFPRLTSKIYKINFYCRDCQWKIRGRNVNLGIRTLLRDYRYPRSPIYFACIPYHFMLYAYYTHACICIFMYCMSYISMHVLWSRYCALRICHSLSHVERILLPHADSMLLVFQQATSKSPAKNIILNCSVKQFHSALNVGRPLIIDAIWKQIILVEFTRALNWISLNEANVLNIHKCYRYISSSILKRTQSRKKPQLWSFTCI